MAAFPSRSLGTRQDERLNPEPRTLNPTPRRLNPEPRTPNPPHHPPSLPAIVSNWSSWFQQLSKRLSANRLAAEEDVFESDGRLGQQMREKAPRAHLAEILAVGLAACQVDPLVAVEENELMAEQVDDRLVVVAGQVVPPRFFPSPVRRRPAASGSASIAAVLLPAIHPPVRPAPALPGCALVRPKKKPSEQGKHEGNQHPGGRVQPVPRASHRANAEVEPVQQPTPVPRLGQLDRLQAVACLVIPWIAAPLRKCLRPAATEPSASAIAAAVAAGAASVSRAAAWRGRRNSYDLSRHPGAFRANL